MMTLRSTRATGRRYHMHLQTALRPAHALSLEPLLDDLIDFFGLLGKRPMCRSNLGSRQIWNKSIHALRHFRLEDRVVCRLDEENRLFDDLFV